MLRIAGTLAGSAHGLHEVVELARGRAGDPRLRRTTATSAFSTGLRGSRKPGKQDPVLSFGTLRLSGPSRVSSVRSR